MTPGLDLVPKKTRESTSKVRTGCSICKARRVKCDEAKPICRRCAIGCRKCEYNTANTVPQARKIIVYLPHPHGQPLIFMNARGVDFFHHNLAAKLDGQFESRFWSKLVLQLSHSEPSIRHAVSAISVIYQDVESSLRHPAGYVNANPEAQQEWNTALKRLSTRIQSQPDSNLVPLACCLLFTCVDFLRGNVESSLLHVQSGINILAALERDNDKSSETWSNAYSSDSIAIKEHIVPMFSRLSVLCSLAGRTALPISAPTAKEDSPHEDLADSRRRLFEISNTCIRFIGEVIPKAAVFHIDFEDIVAQHKLNTTLDAWREQLDELLERLQAAGKPMKQDALNLLLVHYKLIYIWMRVCTIAGESATDSYFTEFEELVICAEQIAEPGVGIATPPQPLSFDLQTLGPLYYTALKCRHPAIRRRALESLKLAPRREGLWNAHYAYVTATRVIELEEGGLSAHGFPDETVRVHGLPLPDDESRTYNIGVVACDSENLDHRIVPSPTYPGTLKAVFRTKPWGLLGEWQILTEYIKL